MIMLGCAGEQKSNEQRKTIAVGDSVVTLHQDTKYTIYGKRISITTSYNSHIVWVVNSNGEVVSISTH